MTRTPAAVLGLSLAPLLACGASAAAPAPAPEPAPSAAAPANEPASSAQLIRQSWDFADPRGSEQRFRALAEAARQRGAQPQALELETQVARAQGLDGRFAEAQATLERVAAQAPEQPVVRLRLLLEQGRVLNSSRQPARARPLFEQAWELGQSAHLDGLAVDAAHMVAIALQDDPDAAIAWNEKALALAQASSQPEARRWLPSLLNNQGWSYFDKRDYQRALTLFEQALALRSREGDAEATLIARWCVAKTLRMLGELERALELQRALQEQYARIGKVDGFVFEELGECHLALGHAAESRAWFAKAYTELSKDSDFAQREAPRLARMRSLAGL